MGDIKNKYGANGQAITCTLASLADGALRASAAVDNSSNDFQDVLVAVAVKTGASRTAYTDLSNWLWGDPAPGLDDNSALQFWLWGAPMPSVLPPPLTGYVNVWVAGSADGGATFSDGASGADSSFTPTSPMNNLRLLGQINAPNTATTYRGGPWSLASAFNGEVPDHFVLIIENETGTALDSTEGNHSKVFQGVASQYT